MKPSVVIAISIAAPPAFADTFAEEPTAGVQLPAAPLAGEFDGRVVATNPGGLVFVRGAELALALDVEDEDVATSGGSGTGAYAAWACGGRLLPRMGIGIGVEWLRSSGLAAPDPGSPVRYTLASAQQLGKHFGYGSAWHHFSGDGAVDGLDTFDFGWSARAGNRLALGGVVRDLTTPEVAGVAVQRRYELEAVVRPTATDRLDVALGARIGERRRDVDGWARIGARIVRGVFVQAAVESREIHRIDDAGVDLGGRELRATAGLELSFGATGVIALATGVRDDRGANHALGGQLVLRASSAGTPSVFGRPDHIQRVEIAGELGMRETTALVRRLRAIADDPTVKAVVLALDHPEAGIGTLQEIRDEILALRRAGKQVFAHALTATQRDYFLASAADKVYLDPAGMVEVTGIAATIKYYRGTLDQLGVFPQFEKIAEYKSAPEAFLESKASPDAAKMTNALIDSLWDQWIAQVAACRKLAPGELRALVDRGPFTADEAGRLVDGVVTTDELDARVRTDLGRKLPTKEPRAERPDRWRRPTVAVIYVDGEIRAGASRAPIPIPLLGGRVAGSDTLVAAIKDARNDPGVGAIVLRLSSPGGESLASELIAREVLATRGKKPIVCSIGDVAASGAYFIAAGCDSIFAPPMALTGSIGVFAGGFDISRMLAKLGVTTETYKRGARADFNSQYRSWTDDERVMVQAKIRHIYDRFVGFVARGRNMKPAEVDRIGRGHVYTGDQAKPINLVTHFGGLNAALDEAKRRMNLAPAAAIDITELPVPERNPLGPAAALIGAKSLDALLPRDQIQTRMPFDLEWR